MFKKHVSFFFIIFLIGLSTFPALSSTFYTYTNGGSSGLWNVANTWTTDPSGLTLTGSAVPGNNDNVHILNGFTVNLSSNLSTTGLSINIHNGGTLDLGSFTTAGLSSLSGSGTLKIGSGFFPTITSNSFVNNWASGATVEYDDFTGNLPVSINYPNLVFTNTTVSNHNIRFSNTSAYSFTIFGNLVTRATGTGTLTVTLGTQASNSISLTTNRNATIGAGTTLNTGVFNAIHSITLNGNLTNNGTVDLSNGGQYSSSSTGAASLTFTGASDNTLACNGLTDLYTLTVNKGLGSANILSVTSTNVSNLNFYSNDKLLNILAGTLRLGANINIPRLYGSSSANYDLGSSTLSPMMWVDGASVNTNGNAFVVYGKFRMTAGSFTCVGAQGTVIREEGQYIIEGGTFTTEKFRPSTTASTHRGSFIMTGGELNANGTTGSNNGYARFSLPYPEQVFIMSGGTINVSNPESSGGASSGGIHIGCKASNYIVTGGTFNAILSGSASAFRISSTAPFWNLNITRTGGNPTTVELNGIGSIGGTITTAQPLTVLNDFTIDGVNNPVFAANGYEVTIGKNFTINSGATYTPGSNTTTFNGTTDQSFTNNGTITSGLYDFTVNKSAGTLTLAGTATNFTVIRNLMLTSGILNDGGKSLQVAGDIEINSIHTGTGNVTLNGSTTQNISGEGTGIFGNLVLNNSSVPGALLEANLAVSGTLTLAGTGNSLFDIQHYQLSLTSTSATALATTGNPFGSAKMIRTLGLQSDRGIRKTFGNLTAFTYAFGVGSNYTPATIQITSAPTTYGTITARPVNSRHQFVVAGNTNNLTWYWKVASSGFTGLGATAVSHTYNYVESSVSPSGDDVNYVPARYNPTTWTVTNNTSLVNETTNRISLSGVGYIDGDFTAGVPSAFGVVNIFYSKRNGNWSDTSPGTTPWSNVSHSGPDASTSPGPGDQVFIGDGSSFNHTITVTTNNQSAGGLEINSGSTLDVGVTTGHNFGRLENVQISGSGTLRISSATATAEFPAGDFGNFIRSNGGTVEYYTTGAQNFTIPLTSSAPTNLPLISYKNLLISPGAGRNITMPNHDQQIFGNFTIQGADATGVVRLNSASATSLTVNGNLSISSGNLQFRNQTIQTVTVDGNLTIGANGVFNINGSGTAVTNELFLNGNLTNNGILDLANGSYICNTTFAGISNTSITGTGATTDFNILTVNKGTSQSPVLNVNASAFSLSGATLPLVLSNGTFRLSSAQIITIANGASFNIPSTARLSANGGTLEITGNDDINLLLAGTLEILSGTVNVGTTAHENSIEYASTGQPTINISGGALNVQSQVRRSTASAQGTLFYNHSGSGVVTVGISDASATTRGVFEILNSGSSFAMSGGTLRIVRASGSSSISDLYLQPTSHSITGGTIELGTGSTSQTIDVNTLIPLYNLTVTGSSNTGRLEFNALTLRGSLSINATDVFNANSLNVSIAGNFTNNNTSGTSGINSGGYQVGSSNQTTTFNGTANHQTLAGVSGNLTNFANLIINNNFTNGMVSLQPNTNLRVNGTLNLSNGTLEGNDNTITAINSVYNAATHTSTGSGSITLSGSSAQFISGNGSGKFGNLVLNNGSGATFTANHEITGNLTLTNGSLNISAYLLYLSSTSLSAINGASPSRYIISSGNLSAGGVRKAFAGSVTNGNFVFPIGVAGKYTPASYTVTTGTTGGNVTIIPVNSKHPSATGSGTSFINYYWSVNSSIVNLTSVTHTYTYVASDESGTPADYRDARFSGGAWTIGITSGNPNTTTRVITFANTDLPGDYSAGEPTAFVNPTTYTSIASGNWESDGSVWDIDPPGTNLGPPAGSFVIISEGHTVTVTSNTKRMATLDVRGRLHLGTTTGHDFGTVTTSGAGARTIQIQTSTFPTGNFSAFTAAGGGTVEYDGSMTLPTQATYNNLVFTSSGVRDLANVDLIVNGNLTIAGGTVNNSSHNRNITLTNSSGDFTNNGTFLAGNGEIIIGRHLLNNGASANFSSGNGTNGLKVFGNLTNSSSATFNQGSDSIGVRGNFNNSAAFIGSSGAVRVRGNFNNTGGTFSGNSGIVSVSGSLMNNATFNAGTGPISVRGSLTNSGGSAVYNANTNLLTISGNFTNTTGAIFNANSGETYLSGDWSNSSTFNAGNGNVIFNHSGTQTLSGTTTFYNLSRTNGGTLRLSNNISVSSLLSFSGGNIVTGSNTISLTNTATQPVIGYGVSGYVDGRLSISYPNSTGTGRIFPVGKGSIYRPVTIQQTNSSSSPVVRVEMINLPPSGTFPAEIESLSEARYYSIDLLSGTMNNPIVEINFNTNAPVDESISVAGNVQVLRSDNPAGPWTNEGGSGVFSPAAPAGYVTSGITSLGNPTFFTLGYEASVLPIELRSFEAKLVDGVVRLKWSTYTEINNDFFTIERSSNGKKFDPILSVPGAGNSKDILYYEDADEYPLAGISYYRLKQTDFDGKFSYSRAVSVNNTQKGGPTFIVYPNPARLDHELWLRVTSSHNELAHMVLSDAVGKVYFEGNVDLSHDVDLTKLNLNSSLASGIYLIRVSFGEFSDIRKVVIE